MEQRKGEHRRQARERAGWRGRECVGRGGRGGGRRLHGSVHRVHHVRAEVAVRAHRALRPAGRARRVHDRGVVLGLDLDVGQRRGGKAPDVGEHVLDRGLAHVRLQAFQAFVIRDQHAGAGVGQPVRQLVSRPPCVQRHDDRADAARRPERHRPLRQVAHGDGDAVALLHAKRHQVRGERVHDLVYLRVGVAAVLVDDERVRAVHRAQLPDRADRRRRVLEDLEHLSAYVHFFDIEHRVDGLGSRHDTELTD